VGLSLDDQRTLLRVARSAIESALLGKFKPQVEFESEALQKRSGVFVTLKIGSDLRGCIGYVEPIFPLGQATQEVAVKAALEDPRFIPLSLDEFKKTRIEISAMSSVEELTDIANIEIGKHGLVIEAGNRRGLLLPQVAQEYGWDLQQFLKQTSVKAGLPPDAWKRKDAKLFIFSVDNFDESLLVNKTK
jgi:AmmeMemoRadiSam system protein A